MIRRIFLPAACLALLVSARADGLTRGVQEALRTRKLYYGEVDGMPGAETMEALRRFQEKKGLDPTGMPDEATLRELGLLPHTDLKAPASERVEQSRDFIERYLHACESGNMALELAFYANRVNYMEEGTEDKGDLQAELASYRQNWPERHFKLMHCVASPNPSNPDEIVATFRYQYDVRDVGGRERKGLEDLNVILRSLGGDLKIVSVRGI